MRERSAAGSSIRRASRSFRSPRGRVWSDRRGAFVPRSRTGGVAYRVAVIGPDRKGGLPGVPGGSEPVAEGGSFEPSRKKLAGGT